MIGDIDLQLSWHTPIDAELDFALDIFKQLVEPSLTRLDGLLNDVDTTDATWRNEFCR